VSHHYLSVGVFTVTATAYNKVDAQNASLVVTVQDIIRSESSTPHLPFVFRHFLSVGSFC